MLKFIRQLASSGLQLIGVNRAWLTLLVVAGAGAFLYVRFTTVAAQRDRLGQWIDVACASAGAPYIDPLGKARPGAHCQARIAANTAFRADTNRVTAAVLAEAASARDAKLMRDTAETRRAAESARAAALAMEKANADLKDDRVAGAWFDAFNGAAGLQPPPR